MEQYTIENVIVSWDKSCGNAPKRLQIKEFIVAMTFVDEPYLDENIVKDIEWSIVGKDLTLGSEAFVQQLCAAKQIVKEIHITNVITHGNIGSADGIIVLDSHSIAFCHVFVFGSGKSSKVKKLTSYFIPLHTK